MTVTDERPKDEYLTRQDVANRLKVTSNTLAHWAMTDDGPPFIKIRTSVRYKLSALMAWEDAQAKGGSWENSQEQGGAA